VLFETLNSGFRTLFEDPHFLETLQCGVGFEKRRLRVS